MTEQAGPLLPHRLPLGQWPGEQAKGVHWALTQRAVVALSPVMSWPFEKQPLRSPATAASALRHLPTLPFPAACCFHQLCGESQRL